MPISSGSSNLDAISFVYVVERLYRKDYTYIMLTLYQNRVLGQFFSAGNRFCPNFSKQENIPLPLRYAGACWKLPLYLQHLMLQSRLSDSQPGNPVKD